MVIMRK